MGSVQQQSIGWIVIYPTECSMCFVMAVFPPLNVYSAACLKGVALGHYSALYLLMTYLMFWINVVLLFTDDTTIHFAWTSISELRNTLQSELQLLVDWICENRLVLNVAKTKSILFRAGHATNSDNQLCLSLKGSDIEQVQEANLLGVTWWAANMGETYW